MVCVCWLSIVLNAATTIRIIDEIRDFYKESFITPEALDYKMYYYIISNDYTFFC